MQQEPSDFKNFIDLIIDISMVIGPVLGYIYQYWLIKNKNTLGTFSIDVCGILLFANITRLNFYIFQKYKLALFFQSIVMVIVQMFLLHLCTNVSRKQLTQSQLLSTSAVKNFWRWSYFYYFFLFILGFSCLLTGISYLMFYFDQTGTYGTIVGLVALMVESILILPQIINNCKKGMVKGVSHLLLTLNLLGDIFKLVYFLLNHQSFQFILCGVTQVILDSFVISQIFYYRWKNTAINQFQNEVQPGYQLNKNGLTPTDNLTDKQNLEKKQSDKDSEKEQPIVLSNSQLVPQKSKRRKRSNRTSTTKESQQS